VAFTNGAGNAFAWLGAEVSGLLRDLLGVPRRCSGPIFPITRSSGASCADGRRGPHGAAGRRPPSRLSGAGATWRDPWSAPAPLRGPQPAKPIPVALVVDPAGQGTATQVQDGTRKAARALADAGYAVQEVQPPSIDVAAKTLLDMLNTPDNRALWQRFSPAMPADTQRFLAAFHEVAGDPDPVTAMQSFMVRQSLLRAWGQFQQQHPLIVAPIYTDVPFQAGTDLDEGRVAATIHGMRMAMAVNALGLPAVAVGITDGLPQAVQLIGPRYREDLCLDAAAALEDRVGTITPIDPRWR
jgi:amidase